MKFLLFYLANEEIQQKTEQESSWFPCSQDKRAGIWISKKKFCCSLPYFYTYSVFTNLFEKKIIKTNCIPKILDQEIADELTGANGHAMVPPEEETGGEEKKKKKKKKKKSSSKESQEELVEGDEAAAEKEEEEEEEEE